MLESISSQLALQLKVGSIRHSALQPQRRVLLWLASSFKRVEKKDLRRSPFFTYSISKRLRH